MGGLIGRLFREFAVTLAIAIGVSAVLSLTLTPMMCALPAASPQSRAASRAASRARSSAASSAMLAVYDRRLDVGARAPALDAARHARDASALTVLLAVVVPKGFFPQQDTGLIARRHRGAARRLVRAHDGAAAARCADVVLAAIPTSPAWPRSSAPTAPTRRTNSGRLSITLKPRERAQRRRRARSSPACSRSSPQVDGHRRSTCSRCRTCRSTAARSRTQYQYTLEDADPDELAAWAPRVLERAARRCPSCATWPATSRAAGCSSTLTIDRDTAARLGVSPQAIDDTLYDAFGQRQVSTIFTQLNLYRVILEVKPEFQQRPERARRSSTCARRRARRCRSRRFAHFERGRRAARRSPTRASSRR